MHRTTLRRRRFLFCSRPEYGHVYPVLPLAAEVRDAGHEILFATGAAAIPVLSRFGFPVHRVGVSIRDGFAELIGDGPIPSTQERVGQYIAREVFGMVLPRHTIRDLRPVCDTFSPDVIVYTQWDIGASVVAAMTGVPAFRHAVGRARPPGGDDRGALLAEYGVTGAVSDYFLDIYPPSLQEPSALDDPLRLVMRPIAWADPRAGVPSWVGERSRPLVYLTLGSTSNDQWVLEAAIAGLAMLDVDVLVALGPISANGIRVDSERMHLTPWVNQAEVLRHADLVVHHGGSGTMLGAIAAGLPQLVLPQRADQFINAEVVVSSGIGRALRPGELTPGAIAAAAGGLAAAEFRRVVAAVQTELNDLPAPADVLPRMLDIVDKKEAARTCTAP